MKRVNIFLDDLRDAPLDFIRTHTVEETIDIIRDNNNIGILSLDNDLGVDLTEGYKVLDWIEEQFYTNPNFQLPQKIIVHSSNAAARGRMERVIQKLYP